MSGDFTSFSNEALLRGIPNEQRRDILRRFEQYVKINGNPPPYKVALKRYKELEDKAHDEDYPQDEVTFADIAEKPLYKFSLPSEREFIRRVLNK